MTPTQSVPFYAEEALSALDITSSQVADLIEKLIRDRDAGKVWSAPKASLSVPDDRYIMSTIAVADDPPYLAIKSLLLNPRNPGNGEPLMNSIIALQDSETGRPIALLDGNWITAVRTAALSLVAARRMAKPDSRVIAFIGSGLQARSHLDALAEHFPLTDVRMFGRGQANLNALSALAADHGCKTHIATTPQEAMRGADLVISSITRVPGAEPFADVADIEPGAFASLVDLARPWHPGSLKALDKIIIDDSVQEATMKDPMVPLERVTGDLADLVLDRVDMSVAPTARTAFIFRGYALGDFALAALAYQAASAAV